MPWRVALWDTMNFTRERTLSMASLKPGPPMPRCTTSWSVCDTQVTDAFNLAAAGRTDTGIEILAPGETLTAAMRVHVDDA